MSMQKQIFIKIPEEAGGSAIDKKPYVSGTFYWRLIVNILSAVGQYKTTRLNNICL